MKAIKDFPIDQSALFKIKGLGQLAERLHSSGRYIERLANTPSLYKCWEEQKKNGSGLRYIEAPFDNLKAVQKRIAYLLSNIMPPAFLMAPVKGRSYVNNAAMHIGGTEFHLLDVEDFFPSCKTTRVFSFFRDELKCAGDVSAILTKLTTKDGYLPQGSPASPILAYYAYKPMWIEIDRMVRESGCTLSVYADDITISGKHVPGKLIWDIKKCLFRFEHSYKPSKEFSSKNKAVSITGVIVRGECLLLPNSQHLKLSNVRKQYDREKVDDLRKSLRRQLTGRLAQQKQILTHV